MALRTRHTMLLQQKLGARGVSTDSREPVLRVGPAPYLSDAQLEVSISALGEVLTDVTR